MRVVSVTKLVPDAGDRFPVVAEAPSNAYDEYSEKGETRAHQRRLQAFLEGSSRGEIDRLSTALRQRIAAHEVTFNILGAPSGSSRPWQLDPLPLVIARDRWETLARGLRQRAKVLSAMYADFYGQRRLLSEGVVPAQLVLGNPDFARACSG